MPRPGMSQLIVIKLGFGLQYSWQCLAVGAKKFNSQECSISLVSHDGRPMTSQAAICLPE